MSGAALREAAAQGDEALVAKVRGWAEVQGQVGMWASVAWSMRHVRIHSSLLVRLACSCWAWGQLCTICRRMPCALQLPGATPPWWRRSAGEAGSYTMMRGVLMRQTQAPHTGVGFLGAVCVCVCACMFSVCTVVSLQCFFARDLV